MRPASFPKNLPAESLSSCPLFQSMTIDQITGLLNQATVSVTVYQKDALIALEGAACDQLSIVLEGQVIIKKMYGSGKSVTVTTMSPGDTFGEVMVYADHQQLPSTIAALTEVKLLQIPRNDILNLCRLDALLLENFLRMLSNKVWILNEKLKLLSYGSIRQKIAGNLLELYRKQSTAYLVMEGSRQQQADQLGIPRPSLSRELARMKADGLIDYWKNHVRILRPEKLENIMLE